MEADLQNALVKWFDAMEALSRAETGGASAVSLAAARAAREERARRETLYQTLRNLLQDLGGTADDPVGGAPKSPARTSATLVVQPDPKRCS